jgi:hypothetical protein
LNSVSSKSKTCRTVAVEPCWSARVGLLFGVDVDTVVGLIDSFSAATTQPHARWLFNDHDHNHLLFTTTTATATSTHSLTERQS